jgi:hypothetical protein
MSEQEKRIGVKACRRRSQMPAHADTFLLRWILFAVCTYLSAVSLPTRQSGSDRLAGGPF